MNNTIPLVEDDVRLSNLVKDYLEAQGYSVFVEYQGDLAVDRIINENPDLVILDLMLPGKDGLSICRDVRTQYNGPILILTAREDDMDQIAKDFAGGDHDAHVKVARFTSLTQIAAVFNHMAGKTQKLLASQKELANHNLRKLYRNVIMRTAID